MKTDNFAKVVLTVIAFGLLLNCAMPFFTASNVRAQAARAGSSSGRQQWEYKAILRNCDFSRDDQGRYVSQEWKSWYEDGIEIPKPIDMVKKARQLGEDGWELVTVVPSSDVSTESLAGSVNLDYINHTQLNGFSMGGATTSERWIFKRRK